MRRLYATIMPFDLYLKKALTEVNAKKRKFRFVAKQNCIDKYELLRPLHLWNLHFYQIHGEKRNEKRVQYAL